MALTENLVNNFFTQLAVAIDDSQVVMVVDAQAPAAANFRVLVEQELIKVTDNGTLTWTIERGAEGTTPAAHAAGTLVIAVLTAEGLNEWGNNSTGLLAHIADATGAHAASAISIVDVGGYYTSPNVEGALQEVGASLASGGPALAAHIADPVGAHAASAISIVDAGGYYAAIEVEGALQEAGATGAANTATGAANAAAIAANVAALANHIADAIGAHAASAISVVDAGGYFSSNEVEGVLQEVGAALLSGGTTPGGADTNVQFNDAGIFGGDALFTWDKVANALTVLGDATIGANISTQLTSNQTFITMDGIGNVVTVGVIGGSSLALNANDELLINGDAGSAGEVLTSGGAGAAPTWAPSTAVVEPANQVVFGTGVGVDSSASLTFDDTTDILTVTNGAQSLQMRSQAAAGSIFAGSSALRLSGGTSYSTGVNAIELGNNSATGVVITGWDSGSAATNGGQISLAAGNGNTTGLGGAVTLTAGQGGATAAGGEVAITAGAGGGTSGNGGAATFKGGDAVSGSTPGAATLLGGGGTAIIGGDAAVKGGTGATVGGLAYVLGGDGGSFGGNVGLFGGIATTSGPGGSAQISGGNAVGGNNNGGAVTIAGGDEAGAGTPGAVSIETNLASRLSILGNGAWSLAGDQGGALEVLTSNGTGVAPTWQAVTAAAVTVADAGDYFDTSNVEDVLQELGEIANASSGRVWTFRADVSGTTPVDPGSGQIRWNNATQNTATQLYVDDLTEDGIDISLFIPNLVAGSTLLLQARNDATRFQLFQATSAPVDNTGWWTIPVTIVSSSGGNFTGGQRMIATAYDPTPGTATTAAEDVTIADAGDYYTVSNVEDALQVLGLTRGSAMFQHFVDATTAASLATQGCPAPTTAGGSSSGAQTSTSVGAFWTRRIQTCLATTANTSALARMSGQVAVVQTATGANAGGYIVLIKFTTPVVASNARFFAGLFTAGAMADAADPSAAVNIIGVAKDEADTNWQIIHNDGSGAATKTSAGFAPAADSAYELWLIAPEGGASTKVWFRNMETGAVAQLTPNTNLPAIDTQLYFQVWANTGSAGGTAVSIGVSCVHWGRP